MPTLAQNALGINLSFFNSVTLLTSFIKYSLGKKRGLYETWKA